MHPWIYNTRGRQCLPLPPFPCTGTCRHGHIRILTHSPRYSYMPAQSRSECPFTHTQHAHIALLVNLHTSIHTHIYEVGGLWQGFQDPKRGSHPPLAAFCLSGVDSQVSQTPGRVLRLSAFYPFSQGKADLAKGGGCV